MDKIKELEKEYAFDMMRVGTPEWEGVPYLFRKDSHFYKFAKERGQVKSITEAVDVFINIDCSIYTINKDPNSRIIKDFLVSKGISSDRIMEF